MPSPEVLLALVATMPVYLNALTGDGVHVVTVNDFLARRDSEWMGPIYKFLGLTVGLIQHDMNTAERQVGYRADITYGTNNEFGFDYLRDNMAIRPEMRVQRKLNYAIIDEVDSILVDEARTPLIISGRPEKSTDLYYKVDEVVRRLRKEEHFTVDEKQNSIILTDEGMEACERMLGIDDLYTNETIGLVHIIQQSLKAHEFFKKDDEYIVRIDQRLDGAIFTHRVTDADLEPLPEDPTDQLHVLAHAWAVQNATPVHLVANDVPLVTALVADPAALVL